MRFSIFGNSKNRAGYIFTLLIIIFSSGSAVIFMNPLSLLIPFGWGMFLFLKKGQNIGRSGIMIFLIFLFFVLVYLIKFDLSLYFGFTLRVFMYIAIAMFAINILGLHFFIYYENIVYSLAVVSLALFAVQLINFDLIYNVILFVNNLFGSILTTVSPSSILYSCSTQSPLRNSGFCWEPGGFANFLILALIINVFLFKNNIKNRKFIILSIALLTTFSTVGYIAYFLLIIFILTNKNKAKLVLASVLIMPIAFLIFENAPFMKDKLYGLSHEPEVQIEHSIEAVSTEKKTSASLGRFAGLLMNLSDFEENPFFGFGGHTEYSMAGKLDMNLFSVNGLGNWLARFGIVGFAFLLVGWWKSLSFLCKQFNFKGLYVLMIIILSLGFSFSLLETPVFFCFMLSCFFFVKRKEIKNRKNNPTVPAILQPSQNPKA